MNVIVQFTKLVNRRQLGRTQETRKRRDPTEQARGDREEI